VLVVEDDRDMLEALAALLDESGYAVLRARNGVEALLKLETEAATCDLILLDLMMPVMNGWDFRRKQLQMPAIAGIPVLLMSAGAHLATATGDLRAAGYLAKPVETTDLLEVVRQHVS
jgi:two-component system, chemotaxis family, chemotaxis protein CheY